MLTLDAVTHTRTPAQRMAAAMAPVISDGLHRCHADAAWGRRRQDRRQHWVFDGTGLPPGIFYRAVVDDFGNLVQVEVL